MSLKQTLIEQINSGKIVFDNNSSELKTQLLGENAGQLITESLQKLILFLSRNTASYIRISSIVRDTEAPSHHGKRRAVDIGNEEIAEEILGVISNDLQVSLHNIDEIIFDAGGATPLSRNKWNYNNGVRHEFNNATLSGHSNHIHISVKL